jgi:hypothetical protein
MLVQRPLRASPTVAATVLAVAMSALVACGSGGVDTAEPIDSRTDDAVTATTGGDDGADAEAPDPEAGQAGTGEAPLSITSDGEHSCSGEDVTIEGVELDVELSGSCGDVVVSGQGNDVDVDDAAAVSLRGVGHDVDIAGSVGALDLAGTNHELSYSGDPPVTDRSVGSSLDRD